MRRRSKPQGNFGKADMPLFKAASAGFGLNLITLAEVELTEAGALVKTTYSIVAVLSDLLFFLTLSNGSIPGKHASY